MERRNLALKIALLKAGVTQADLAFATRISEFKISRAINGRGTLSEEEKERIADALEAEVGEIFPKSERRESQIYPAIHE